MGGAGGGFLNGPRRWTYLVCTVRGGSGLGAGADAGTAVRKGGERDAFAI